MKKNPIVAAIQMTSSDSVSENLATAADLILEAVSKKARLVVLPEMFALIASSREALLAVAEDEKNSGPIQNFLAQQARQYGIWLVGGTIPIKQAENRDKVFAAVLLYSPEGIMVARYNKMHLFDVFLSESEYYCESERMVAGNEIVVQKTDLGYLGLAVCYDIRFPELFRAMFNQDVEIFTLPAAFTFTTGQAHWEILLRSRAIENLSYMIGACQTGEHSTGRITYGHSAIISPWGEILAMQPAGVGVVTAPIDLDYLYEVRKKLPVKQHQRLLK